MCLNCGVKKSKMLNTKETIKMPIICGQIHVDLFEAALFCLVFLKKSSWNLNLISPVFLKSSHYVSIMSFLPVVEFWNVKIFIYFFVFCWIKKKGELLCKFCNEITQPFLNLEGTHPAFCSIIFFNCFIFNTNWTPCPNDMIHTQCVSNIWILLFCYQNCSDLLWEKIVLVIGKNFWNSRLKAENLQKFWDH